MTGQQYQQAQFSRQGPSTSCQQVSTGGSSGVVSWDTPAPSSGPPSTRRSSDGCNLSGMSFLQDLSLSGLIPTGPSQSPTDLLGTDPTHDARQ